MKKILVLDDDEDILEMVRITLTMRAYTVEAILSWSDLQTSVTNFQPDLILLDVSLSGADGCEMCRKLKQSPAGSQTPVILFSAHAGLGNTYRECLADDFIAKPFNISYLLETIKRQLA